MRKNQKVVVSAAAVSDVRITGACGGSTSSQATSTEAASEAETEAAEAPIPIRKRQIRWQS